MNKSSESYVLSVAADETTALILAEALADWNLGVRLPEGGASAVLEIFCATRAEASERLGALRALAPQARFESAEIKPVERQDWAESWKRFFHVQRVSERIIVKPSWEPAAAGPEDCVVEIDPGLSFGTGLHGTTRACLRFLDDWQRRQPRASVLDLGCGTGILAIAAAKLGFPRITAVDNDPAAVRVARANAAGNGVADRIEFVQADLGEFTTAAPYDLVLANLLAGLLVEWADRIIAAASRSSAGGLVLSGILEEQFDAVRCAYVKRGFAEQESVTLEGWQTGRFGRSLFPEKPSGDRPVKPDLL